MRTITVIALKGGSGKTTVATHLALAAYLRGIDTLLVDTDPQHSATDVLSARAEQGPGTMRTTGPKLLSTQIAAVGFKKELMIVDTAAGAVEDVSEAIVLSDFCVLVVRPTLLDISGLVRSFSLVKKLGKPCAVVINQAPVARETVEAPLVKRAMKGLDYMQAPTAPVIIRNRAIYQTVLERGRSAEESNDQAAAKEIAALWDYLQEAMAEADAMKEVAQ